MNSLSLLRRASLPLFLLAFLTTSAYAPAAQAEIKAHGLTIVPWSRKIGEGRFISGRDFAKTVKFFRKNFYRSKRVRWHAEVNLPRVKYKHLENLSKKRKWDGVNIYEIKNKVYIYVLPHEVPAEPSKSPKAKSPKAKLPKK